MACGGLKSAEKKIDSRLLNRHHSVRVTDFAMEVSTYSKGVFLKSGKNIDISIGVHTGPVISGVIGDTKPQFSLIGETVIKASHICKGSSNFAVGVSKETHHFLELYTNNYWFDKKSILLKDIGTEIIFSVSNIRGRERMMVEKNTHAIKNFDGHLSQMGDLTTPKLVTPIQQSEASKSMMGVINESESELSNSYQDHNENSRAYDNEWKNVNNDIDMEDQFEYESNKTDLIDDGTMNVFGFNDDLNLDDRLIIQNATDN